jgi:hypothetical protein
MSNPSLDAGIPLLTEIIPLQQDSTPELKPAVPAPALVTRDDTAVLDALRASEWSDGKWERLEREVCERVLQQLLERVDSVLEQRVRDSLADVLQIAVENLAAEIRGGLHHTIKDVVTRAVSQEITQLRDTKN